MTTDDLLEPTAPPAAVPAPAAPRGTLRPVLLRLHFYAGILVGPFLLVAAITGLLYVFAPQLEQVVYDHELHVPAGTSAQPLAAQVTAAQAALPEGTLANVRPGPTATDSTQVIFDVPGLAESYHRTVFVDPYDGEIRGVLDTYGSGQALPIRAWLDNLHRNLNLGDTGRIYSELAASWLAVVVAGGLVLWWGGRRRKRRAATGRARTLSWHATTGTWVALVLFFLSATGLTWSQFAGQNISEVRAAVSWQTPSVPSKLPAAPAGAPVGTPQSIDTILASARSEGLDGPVDIAPPKAGKAYVVKEIQRSWPEKQDSVAVDPNTGQVLNVLRFEDWPLAAKLARWGIDAHMGLLFGLANQIVLTVAMIGLIALIVWGYRMWWQRRPAGRPFPRGSLRRLPMKVLVPLAAAGIVVGWFMPVFGLSLLAFLLLDGFLGWRAHRNRPTVSSSAP